MIVLGISETHCATAAILRDGAIIGCASEERFSRLKNDVAFRPVRTPADTSIHPAWQIAATIFPCWTASRTSATMAGCRRFTSGA